MGESELIFSAQKTWGMVGFSMLAFIQSFGGILASYEASTLSVENAWERIKVNNDKTIDIL
jgi:cellulose synthase (UDP-forming)